MTQIMAATKDGGTARAARTLNGKSVLVAPAACSLVALTAPQ